MSKLDTKILKNYIAPGWWPDYIPKEKWDVLVAEALEHIQEQPWVHNASFLLRRNGNIELGLLFGIDLEFTTVHSIGEIQWAKIGDLQFVQGQDIYTFKIFLGDH